MAEIDTSELSTITRDGLTFPEGADSTFEDVVVETATRHFSVYFFDEGGVESRLFDPLQGIIDVATLPTPEDLVAFSSAADDIASFTVEQLSRSHNDMMRAVNKQIGIKLRDARQKAKTDDPLDDPTVFAYVDVLQILNHRLIQSQVEQFTFASPYIDPVLVEEDAQQAFRRSVASWDPDQGALSTYTKMPIRNALIRTATRNGQKGFERDTRSFDAWDNADEKTNGAASIVDERSPAISSFIDEGNETWVSINIGMRRALPVLSERQQDVIMAKIRQPEATNYEIAKALGVSEGTVTREYDEAMNIIADKFPEFTKYLMTEIEHVLKETLVPYLVPFIVIEESEIPTSLAELGQAIKEAAGDKIESVARDLNLYTASIEALAAGEWIPNEDNIHLMCDYCGLSFQVFEKLRDEARDTLAEIEATSDPMHSHFVKVMSAVTLSDDLSDVMSKLMDGTVTKPNKMEKEHGYPATSIENAMSGKAQTIRKQLRIDQLKEIFGASEELGKLFEEVATQRMPRDSFGDRMHAFELNGGSHIGELIERTESGWNISRETMAGYLGVKKHQAVTPIVLGQNIKLQRTIDAAIDNFGLGERDLANLYKLARGDKDLPEPQDIISSARIDLLKARGDVDAQESIIRETVKKVHRRSGRAYAQIPKVVQRLITEPDREVLTLINNMEQRDEVARTYFPDDPLLARQFANFMLGVAEERKPADLLDTVRAGGLTVGEMVATDRKLKRQTVDEYSKDIDFVFERTERKGLSTHILRDIEKGSAIRFPEQAEALAKHIGLRNKQDVADFTSMLTGKYKWPEESPKSRAENVEASGLAVKAKSR